MNDELNSDVLMYACKTLDILRVQPSSQPKGLTDRIELEEHRNNPHFSRMRTIPALDSDYS